MTDFGAGLLNVLGGLGGASLLNRNPSLYDLAQRRNIQEKSYLEFHFPTQHSLVARLPLYENITIAESKKANLVKYDPIGRNSSLYTHTGASSRQLKISFALTLPHIQGMHHGSKVRFSPGDDPNKTREQIKELMLHGASFPPSDKPVTYTKTPPPKNGKQQEGKEVTVAKVQSEPTNWVKFVSWWVNLIRSSVMNNQLDTTQGPPIVRLTHGELYQNIPCVCISYDLSYDKEAGMDVDSLLSRRILVSMTLEEFRAGDFGDFDRTSTELRTRDNVAGWEAIIAYSSTDPGHDAITLHTAVLDAQMPDTTKEDS